MNKVFFHSLRGFEPVLPLIPLMSLNWIVPALPDGSVVGVAASNNDLTRIHLEKIEGVTVLPHHQSPRNLKPELTARLAKSGMKTISATGTHTMYDVLSEMYAQNCHPIFHPDS